MKRICQSADRRIKSHRRGTGNTRRGKFEFGWHVREMEKEVKTSRHQIMPGFKLIPLWWFGLNVGQETGRSTLEIGLLP